MLVQALNDEARLGIGLGMQASANKMTLLTTKGTGSQSGSGIRRDG